MDQQRIWDYFQNQSPDKFAASLPLLRFLVSEARRFRAEAQLRVLNIGVGDGWLERQCAATGWKTFALDPSPGAIARLADSGACGAIGMIEHLPWADDVFDVVFCSEVLEHLSKEQTNNGLREIARILKPGGLLLGTVPANENLGEGQVVCPHCGSVFHRNGHLQSYDLAGLRSIFPPALHLNSARSDYFYDWATLNWKGRLLALIKKSLLLGGIHGVNENIYFAACKAPVH
jgi:SAM-dependent methyltransferase